MWDEELDVEKIITVKNTTYAIAIKRPELFRLAKVIPDLCNTSLQHQHNYM